MLHMGTSGFLDILCSPWVGYAAAAAGCGLEDGPTPDAPAWCAEARASASDEARSRWALIALAYGVCAPASGFEPGRTFGFDHPGFIDYLGAACAVGAGFVDLAPAWHDFLVHFPHKLAARTIEWTDLLLAARVVHGTDCGAALHAEVRALA